MDSKTQIGLELLGTALLLGLLSDMLLRVGPWGLNAVLWTGALTAAGQGLAHRWRTPLAGAERWWLLPVSTLALLYLWRDAPMLKFTTTAALLAALAFTVQRIQAVHARAAGMLTGGRGLVAAGLHALGGLPGFLLRGIDWQVLGEEGRGRQFAAAARGVVIALPALLVFGLLLTAADAAFERVVLQAAAVDVARLPGHLLWTAAFAWITAAFLRGVLLQIGRSTGESATSEWSREGSLGFVEAGVVLGLVNLLFLAFVLIQLPYLFGGAGVVEHTSGLTLAQYARRGFFELVAVAALALPFLLGLQRLVRIETLVQQRRFRALAGLQVGLLVVMLVSAGQRMWLYGSAFGLTVLRLYVCAFMIWLGLVLVWFVLSVLRGRQERFLPGAAAAGFLIVLLLHGLNPDALIARTNLARALEGKPFDAAYAASLSADAVPVLLRALPDLQPADRAAVAQVLLRKRQQLERSDWRLWNRARREALQQLRTADPLLRTAPSASGPVTSHLHRDR